MRLRALVFALWAIGPASPAWADVLDRIKAAGVLNVGVQQDFPPFDLLKAGQPAGFDRDLFAEIGSELKVRIEFVAQPGDTVLAGLEAGRYDLVASPVTATRVRRARYRLTPPIAEATVALLKRRDDATISTPQDIAGKTIGVSRASGLSPTLRAFAQSLPHGATIGEFDNDDDALAALSAGRAAAFADAWSHLAYLATARPDAYKLVAPPFGAPVWYVYAGRKAVLFASLMDAVDSALVKIKGDGRMAALQKKWFGVAFDAPDVAPETKP